MRGGGAAADAVGFFGKVSTRGDFVARRLPPALVAAWDDWLQHGLQASRRQLGPDWLAHYLSSPVWRFALDPGVLDARAWAGVMMPSVDRVGRHFPLLLAAPGSGAAPPGAHPAEVACWYDRLEELARGSLAPDFVLERLEDALAGCPPPWRAAAPLARQRGTSWWWTGDGAGAAALACAGMPAPTAFAALLDGDWRRWGWREPGRSG